jgi:hypothetical protein
MKTYGGAEGKRSPRIINLRTEWRLVVSFMTQPLYPRRKEFHWTGGWMGPRAGMDMVPKRKALAENGTLDRPAHGLVTILTEISQMLHTCTTEF